MEDIACCRGVIILVLLLSSAGLRMFSDGARTAPASLAESEYRDFLEQESRLIQAAVQTIQSPDGDIVDCIPQEKQPALDHPLLRGHVIHDVLPKVPGPAPENTTESKSLHGLHPWHEAGECPRGTVPILRSHPMDAAAFDRVSKKRPPGRFSANLNAFLDDPNRRDYAIGRYTRSTSYGIRASLAVWKPKVTNSEMSLSQLWVANVKERKVETIEAGWMVYPGYYGGSKDPRMFIFWTNDNYASGCYNLKCKGFVQTNDKFTLGSVIQSVSTLRGKEYEIDLAIWQDYDTADWFLSYDDVIVGYWPHDLFSLLDDEANQVSWGGEIVVYTRGIFRSHTDTQMGSGHFPHEGPLGVACRTHNIRYVADRVNGNLPLIPEEDMEVENTRPACYYGRLYNTHDLGLTFYFGGPGYSPECH